MKKAMDIFVAVLAILFVLNFITNGKDSIKEKEASNKIYSTINVSVEWDKKAESYYFNDYSIDGQKVICDTRYSSDELYKELQKMSSAAEEVNVTMKCGATVPIPSNITYTYVN